MAVVIPEAVEAAEATAGRGAIEARLAAARQRASASGGAWRTHTKTLRKPSTATPAEKQAGAAAARDYDAHGAISEGEHRVRQVTGKVAGVAKSAGSTAAQAASSVTDQGGRAISGGKGGKAARIIFAFGAGLLALELASYVSGRYFTYKIPSGPAKASAPTPSKATGLYAGQTEKLQARKYAGTAQV